MVSFVGTITFALFLFAPQCETASAEVVRGLKKDKGNNKGCGSCKNDPSTITFPMCNELIPAVPPNVNTPYDFELESTCTTTFWMDDAPWINGSPLYVAYYPACSCVILAKDCFLPAVSTFAPLYDVARSTGMSKDEAIAFGTPFIDDECLAYALAFLDQWAKNEEEDLHSND